MFAAALATRSRVATRSSDLPALAAIGILIVGADAMYASATTMGSLAVVAVLSALHSLVTTVLARVHLHERITRTQTAGITAASWGSWRSPPRDGADRGRRRPVSPTPAAAAPAPPRG